MSPQCGVPKKGHVCPYQPKVKRRADEPPPELRNAAIQVEMDEFMTLRRLNIRIQGLPESYVTEPYMNECLVIGEPHPIPLALPPEAMGISLLASEMVDPMVPDSSGPPSPLPSSSTEPITRDKGVGEDLVAESRE